MRACSCLDGGLLEFLLLSANRTSSCLMSSCITTICTIRSCTCCCKGHSMRINSSFCAWLSVVRSGKCGIKADCRSIFHSERRLGIFGGSSYKLWCVWLPCHRMSQKMHANNSIAPTREIVCSVRCNVWHWVWTVLRLYWKEYLNYCALLHTNPGRAGKQSVQKTKSSRIRSQAIRLDALKFAACAPGDRQGVEGESPKR